jgi:hypothetical protein
MMAFQSVQRRRAVATLLAAANPMTINMHGDDGQMTGLAIPPPPHPRSGHRHNIAIHTPALRSGAWLRVDSQPDLKTTPAAVDHARGCRGEGIAGYGQI